MEMAASVLLAPALPVLSEQYGRRKNGRYAHVLNLSLAASLLVIAPLALLQLAVPSLASALFGTSYQSAPDVFQWQMFHSLVVGLSLPFGQVLASSNRMWFAAAYNTSWAVLALGLSYALIYETGAAGLAAAMAIAHAISAIAVIAYLYWREPTLILASSIIGNSLLSFALALICFTASMFLSVNFAGLVGGVAAAVIVAKGISSAYSELRIQVHGTGN
jgi:O-antigen/teichoic acid export membrane protein